MAQVWLLPRASATTIGAVVLLGLALGGNSASVTLWIACPTTQLGGLGCALRLTSALLAEAEEAVSLAFSHDYISKVLDRSLTGVRVDIK